MSTTAVAQPVVGIAPLLQCRGLRRAFDGRVAVDDVSFEIRPGETYGLLGPNGAGKTTTIRMVCGLLRPDGGEVSVAGRPVLRSRSPSKQQIGYVPQDIALYPDLTARENLRFFGRLYGMRGATLEARVGEVLAMVGLADRGDDRVSAYSGGMRRRLNIGAGLVHQPALLVLDEPTVGVDPQSRFAILDSVHRLGESGMAVLYTTHYMEEAERVCDRIGILDRGRLVAEGSRRELVALVGEQDRIRLGATGDLHALARACADIPGVSRADVRDDGVEILAAEAAPLLPALLERAGHAGAVVRSAEVTEPDLEAVFLHLTGTALRE